MKTIIGARIIGNDLQSGDIVDFSVKNEPYKCIKACLYIQYPTHEKWVPILFGTNNPLLYVKKSDIINHCKHLTKMNKSKPIIYPYHLEPLFTFLNSKEAILSHYENINQANHFIELMLS
jgi:hypothetical protein